jgi:hypothetical protein
MRRICGKRDSRVRRAERRLLRRSSSWLPKISSKMRKDDSCTWWSPVRERERAILNATAMSSCPLPAL